jgi:hypothetical protein
LSPLPGSFQTELGAPPCRNKLDGPYDNRIMPIVISVTLIVALGVTFAGTIVSYENDG